MNLPDKEVLLKAKILTEIIESKTVSLTTLEEYKDFIEKNHLVTEKNKEYVFANIIIMALKTNDKSIFESVIDKVAVLDERLNAEGYKALGKWIIDVKTLSFSEFCLKNSLDIPVCENIFLSLTAKRQRLQIVLSNRDLVKIKTFSTEFPEAIHLAELIRSEITWEVEDA